MSDLKFGEHPLAVMSADGTNVRELPGAGRGKAINPQWSPDGSRIYYLSDANGNTNVFSLDAGSGAVRQITNLSTGISGITASSPALSAAARADRLVVSAYERDAYRIYALESAPVLEGRAAVDLPRVLAVLPPVERRTVEVVRLVDNPGYGLPRAMARLRRSSTTRPRTEPRRVRPSISSSAAECSSPTSSSASRCSARSG